jgi:hypothetical protein
MSYGWRAQWADDPLWPKKPILVYGGQGWVTAVARAPKSISSYSEAYESESFTLRALAYVADERGVQTWMPSPSEWQDDDEET